MFGQGPGPALQQPDVLSHAAESAEQHVPAGVLQERGLLQRTLEAGPDDQACR